LKGWSRGPERAESSPCKGGVVALKGGVVALKGGVVALKGRSRGPERATTQIPRVGLRKFRASEPRSAPRNPNDSRFHHRLALHVSRQ